MLAYADPSNQTNNQLSHINSDVVCEIQAQGSIKLLFMYTVHRSC